MAESVLVDWIKEMGRRGVPLHPSTVLGNLGEDHWRALGFKISHASS